MKVTLLTLFFSMMLCSYSFALSVVDYLVWRNINLTSQPGDYCVRGPGIDETNGQLFGGGYYWKATDFRDGDIIFRRYIAGNRVTTYLDDYVSAIKTTVFDGDGTLQDYSLTLSMGSWLSSGTQNITLNSIEIRYYAAGAWEDWIDMNFSCVLPESTVANPNYFYFYYDLRTDLFDMYEVKFNITAPLSADNRLYLPGIAFHSVAVPEPVTVILFIAGLAGIAFRKLTSV